jgi:glycylpeptide N-tetradecanoyltransferase
MSEKSDENKKTGTNGILEMLRDAGVSTASREEERRAFWDTQPMPHGEQSQLSEGPIVPDKKPEEIRPEPYNVPRGFEWSTVDFMDAEQRQELYTLLANNYIEDDDSLFWFDYSIEFLNGL